MHVQNLNVRFAGKKNNSKADHYQHVRARGFHRNIFHHKTIKIFNIAET